jgi:hypothetical protein
MVVREIYHNRIELLQGTLDLLVLETLKWGAQHGYGISQQILSGRASGFRWRRAHCIRRCTGWSGRDGLPANGG